MLRKILLKFLRVWFPMQNKFRIKKTFVFQPETFPSSFAFIIFLLKCRRGGERVCQNMRAWNIDSFVWQSYFCRSIKLFFNLWISRHNFQHWLFVKNCFIKIFVQLTSKKSSDFFLPDPKFQNDRGAKTVIENSKNPFEKESI